MSIRATASERERKVFGRYRSGDPLLSITLYEHQNDFKTLDYQSYYLNRSAICQL